MACAIMAKMNPGQIPVKVRCSKPMANFGSAEANIGSEPAGPGLAQRETGMKKKLLILDD